MKRANFDWTNEVLYRMCRENPAHKDPSIVLGKVLLIGRSYSAAIERKAPKVSGTNLYRDRVGPGVCASAIDRWMGRVADIERVTHAHAPAIIECHKRVTDLFAQVSGGGAKRSLASKYLHFHLPNAFFIFDSRANDRARLEIGKLKVPALDPERRDRQYSVFVYRCLALREDIEKKKRCLITPRELDKHLLDY